MRDCERRQEAGRPGRTSRSCNAVCRVQKRHRDHVVRITLTFIQWPKVTNMLLGLWAMLMDLRWRGSYIQSYLHVARSSLKRTRSHTLWTLRLRSSVGGSFILAAGRRMCTWGLEVVGTLESTECGTDAAATKACVRSGDIPFRLIRTPAGFYRSNLTFGGIHNLYCSLFQRQDAPAPERRA